MELSRCYLFYIDHSFQEKCVLLGSGHSSLEQHTPLSGRNMLRRRTGKDDAPSRDSNDNEDRPRLNRTQTEEDKLRAEFDGAKVKQLVIRPRSKRRNGFIFVLGGLFGIFIALFFANQQEVISLDSLMDLNLESLIDVIPQGIVRDAKAFSVRLPCAVVS